jgi:hypothetical protein
VAVSGGMALVSDDLALLGDDARSLLDDVVALGRVSDAAAMAGSPAQCNDIMRHALPRQLEAGGMILEADDPVAGTSTLRTA